MVERMCKLLIDSIPFSIWIKDSEEKFQFVNMAYAREHNQKPEDFIGKTNQEVFGEKRAKPLDEMLEEVRSCQEIREYERVHDNIFYQYMVVPLINEQGVLEGFAGMILNMQGIKDKELELENQKNILRTIIDTLPHYIFYKDKNSKYMGYNKKWKDYYVAKGKEEIEGKDDFELGIAPEVALMHRKKDEEVMIQKKEQYMELRHKGSNGEECIEECIKIPVINEQGEVWGVVGIARDITKRKQLEEKLRYLSYTDQLTRLYNRTAFEEKIVALNKEEFLPLGIIMGDVNGLKIINDMFGHLVGDNLLREISKILKEVSGRGSFVFRWGGDEFIIVAPKCDERSCNNIINTIIERCENKRVKGIQLSISLGYSIKSVIENNIYETLKEAEERLYCQKLLKQKGLKSDTIYALQKTLEEKKIESIEHGQRLLEYARAIGKKLGMTCLELDKLILVTKFHDIGKIGIKEEILLKEGSLTTEELEVMKTHTEKGFRLLQSTAELAHVSRGVLSHHERWDGKGYPLGLKGENIPKAARIVSIIHAYDAMTLDKDYKKAMSKEEAIKMLREYSGKYFDPTMVNVFLEVLKERELNK